MSPTAVLLAQAAGTAPQGSFQTMEPLRVILAQATPRRSSIQGVKLFPKLRRASEPLHCPSQPSPSAFAVHDPHNRNLEPCSGKI